MATRKRKEAILDLKKHLDHQIRVKFVGGREVVGTLKGYDQLVNIVLDDATEHFEGEGEAEGSSRELGLLVCRGTSVMLICPEEGFEEIANPFVAMDDGVAE